MTNSYLAGFFRRFFFCAACGLGGVRSILSSTSSIDGRVASGLGFSLMVEV
jgi:hypothetical protein